ncbi:hypothetical protein Scep_020260 [Stephania cephalantha]|uniref:Uncharacterized protein n=1 Tax=Stephania cephalantha TaxID=152367 RepID=A0AAP0IDD5_9MAGN
MEKDEINVMSVITSFVSFGVVTCKLYKEYLHFYCDLPLFLRDIKSSSILLDENFFAEGSSLLTIFFTPLHILPPSSSSSVTAPRLRLHSSSHSVSFLLASDCSSSHSLLVVTMS